MTPSTDQRGAIMAQPSDITALTEELAALRARVDELSDGAHRAQPVSRRHLLRGLAGLGAAGAAGVAAAQPAAAADGDNLVLGANNTAMTTTRLTHTQDDINRVGLELSSDGFAALSAVARDGAFCAIAAVHQSQEIGDPTISTVAVDGFALLGSNDSALYPAVGGLNDGQGAGLGAGTHGDGGQLLLEPAEASALGPPTSGNRSLGEIRLDLEGDLWVCVESGSPGSWTRLLREDTSPGRVIPITPIRALDTRATGGRPPGSPVVPGQKKGPLKGGETITLDLAGVAPIPASASGVVGNLTVVSPSYAGFLIARPSGAAATTSSLNFPAGVAALANAFTSRLGPAGLTISGSGTSANTYHLIVDITAYIT